GSYCDIWAEVESCVPELAEGTACISSEQCQSGHWCGLASLDANAFTCVSGSKVGVPCEYDCDGDLECRLATVDSTVTTCHPTPDRECPLTSTCPGEGELVYPTNTSRNRPCELPGTFGEACRANEHCEPGMRCVWDDEESGPVCGACNDHFKCDRYGPGA